MKDNSKKDVRIFKTTQSCLQPDPSIYFKIYWSQSLSIQATFSIKAVSSAAWEVLLDKLPQSHVVFVFLEICGRKFPLKFQKAWENPQNKNKLWNIHIVIFFILL